MSLTCGLCKSIWLYDPEIQHFNKPLTKLINVWLPRE